MWKSFLMCSNWIVKSSLGVPQHFAGSERGHCSHSPFHKAFRSQVAFLSQEGGGGGGVAGKRKKNLWVELHIMHTVCHHFLESKVGSPFFYPLLPPATFPHFPQHGHVEPRQTCRTLSEEKSGRVQSCRRNVGSVNCFFSYLPLSPCKSPPSNIALKWESSISELIELCGLWPEAELKKTLP